MATQHLEATMICNPFLHRTPGRRVAGGPDEAVQQPVWSADGKTLYFISDRSNWWNIYSLSQGKVGVWCWMHQCGPDAHS